MKTSAHPNTLEHQLTDAWRRLQTARAAATHSPNAHTCAAETTAEADLDRLLDLWAQTHPH